MKRALQLLVGLLIVAGLSPVAAAAEPSRGGFDHNSMDPVGRTRDYLIFTSTASPDTLFGNSCAAQASTGNSCGMFAGVEDAFPTTTLSSTVGLEFGTAFPARLYVQIYDESSDSTPSCTTLVLKGRDWKGEPVSETLTTINETAQLTKYGYEKVTSWELTGCASSGDADDDFLIYTSRWYSMPVRIRDMDYVQTVCHQTYDSSTVFEEDLFTCKTGKQEFSSSDFHSQSNSVNLAAAFTLTDKDLLFVRVRGGN